MKLKIVDIYNIKYYEHDSDMYICGYKLWTDVFGNVNLLMLQYLRFRHVA